ncbi:quinone oxidoreductase family protein [Jongsikchunia kroppenstedtii]|uniref:quinone oxidoreductase family protein n=1 Tax=Jongsikchunia kroppenstedtii TaxID=1121721 RepID=UPI00037423B5|nr:quinone oxidoreductase [Jongsikchunia kroppenstedtii]
MRAIQITSTGEPDVMQYTELPDPTPEPGEVVVHVGAAGVNFIDTYQRSGMYELPLPLVLGSEGAGTVVAIGDGVTTVEIGDRVAWCNTLGSYAELVRVRADRLVHVPSDVDDPTAASILLQGITAHYLLDGSAHPEDGDAILVHAGAGGVGLILTQLAKAKGLTVITTVSTDAKAELSAEAGADHVLRYGADLPEKVRALTGELGVAVAYDGVGKDTFELSLAATRVRGMVVLFGAASGPVPPFDLQRLNPAGSLTVTRPTLAHFIADPGEFRWRAGDVMSAVASGAVTVTVGARYALDDAATAHADLQARKTTGSVVLLP